MVWLRKVQFTKARVTNMTNKNDELDRILAEIDAQEDNLEDLRKRLARKANNQSTRNHADAAFTNPAATRTKTTVINRPVIPDTVTVELHSRYEYFLYFINSVNYGSANAKAYVEGHQKALNKAVETACLNPDYLYMVEAMVNDEMNRMSSVSKVNLETKGYSDGLKYVSKALKKSKEYMARQINKILREELH